MLSEDLANLRDWLDRRTGQDGALMLPAALTGTLRFALRDMAKTARAMEAGQIAGPARITDADLASGKVKRLPVVPRPVPAQSAPSDDGGSVA